MDDSPHIVKLIQVNLEFEGYKTIGAFDGKEALEKVTRSKPNLIVLDILMPNLDGWDVLEALKKNPDTVNIPVIVLSAVGRNEDRRRGLELGVSDYVTKPFNAIRLLEAVDHTLHPSPLPSAAVYQGAEQTTRVAITGGSKRALGILQTLLGNSRVKILGLATTDTEGGAAKLAKELKIFITDDPYALCRLPGIDLLIETEPRTLDLERVSQANPNLEVLRGYSTSFVWSLVEEKEASEDRARALVKELHLKIKEINALYEASKVIGSVVELDSVLRFVLDLMSEFVNADHGLLLIKQQEKFLLSVTHGTGLLAGNVPVTLEKAAFRTGKPVKLPKADSGIPYPVTVLVPIGSKEHPVAFVALLFDRNTEISENDLGFLDTLAAQAKIAIEKAKLYADVTQSKNQIESLLSKVIYAQEEERKRIAAEIHDSIAQSLVGALTRVQMCQAILPKTSKEAQAELDELKKLILENIKEVRQLIFNLRPSTLDDLGLVPTLEHFLKKFEAESHIQTSMRVNISQEKLPPLIEATIYRIVQEALNNVKKHSGATEVALEIESSQDSLHLSISDNGSGFDPGKVQPDLSGNSLGIIGMKERVALLGGHFKVNTLKGKGSQIGIQVPLR